MPEEKEGLIPKGVSDLTSYVDGIPLPPVVKKNLWKAIGALITGVVDIPVAWLEGKSASIRDDNNALSLVKKRAAESAAERFGHDDKYVERTLNYFEKRVFNDQAKREKVVAQAIEELKADPSKEESDEEIDDDWLDMFSRVAEQKSNADMQLFLAKILSGEIRKPGSFSPHTVQILSMFSQKTAQLFQAFCSLSFYSLHSELHTCVIVEPYGEPGANALSPVDFSYRTLTQLQAMGLIGFSVDTWKKFYLGVFSHTRISLGGESYYCSPIIPEGTTSEEMDKMYEVETVVQVINFTDAGLELRRILHLSVNREYNDKVWPWLEERFKLRIR